MTETEKIQFGTMQTDIHAVKLELATMGSGVNEMAVKVDKLYIALIGSDLTKDGGLVGRISELEKQNETLENEIQEIKKKAAKSDMYLHIIWGLVGSIGTAVLAYVMRGILHM